jgi:hypothetical protein
MRLLEAVQGDDEVSCVIPLGKSQRAIVYQLYCIGGEATASDLNDH